MKTTARRGLLYLLLMLPLPTWAQINVGLGYQQGFFSMPNADKPVDRFNDKGFLYKNLGYMHWPGGEIYAVSIRHQRLLAEITMNSRRARISAESFSGNVLQRRDLRFSMQALSFGAGYALVLKDKFVLYGAGALEIGYMKLSTRFGPKQNLGSVPYTVYDRGGMLALTAYAKMVFRPQAEAITSWSLTPYFHFPFQEYDFVLMNQILNPADYHLDGSSLPARPWNVGLAINFDLDLLRFLE